MPELPLWTTLIGRPRWRCRTRATGAPASKAWFTGEASFLSVVGAQQKSNEERGNAG